MPKISEIKNNLCSDTQDLNNIKMKDEYLLYFLMKNFIHREIILFTNLGYLNFPKNSIYYLKFKLNKSINCLKEMSFFSFSII